MQPIWLLFASLLLCFAATITSSRGFTLVNLVHNGSFETLQEGDGYVTQGWCEENFDKYLTHCDDSISVDMAPWRVDGIVDIYFNWPGLSAQNCSDGKVCFDLNSDPGTQSGGVYTEVSVTKGRTYQVIVDVGGDTNSCDLDCIDPTSVRNLSITFHPNDHTDPFATFIATLDLADDVCTWRTFAFNVTMQYATPILWLYSLNGDYTNCGPQVDNVRLYWLGCLTGTSPLQSPGITVYCADGWSAVPTSGSTPVPITGSISVSVLNVTTTPTNPSVLTIGGIATIDGTLIIDVTAPVQDGDSTVVLQATNITGGFTSVQVTQQGKRVCGDSQVLRDGQTIAVLFRGCNEGSSAGLKGWQVALIAVGGVLVASLVTLGLVLLAMRLKKRRMTERNVARF